MQLSLKLVETNRQIEREILKALLADCNMVMNKAVAIVKKELPNIVYSAVVDSPEYMSLSRGKLRLELGIPDADSKIAGLIDTWIRNIDYRIQQPKISKQGITASFEAGVVRADFSDVLGTADAYVSDNIRGYNLPWLRWLLLEGSKVIIPSYEVEFGPNPRSRTGGAVMIKGAGWGVSQYSGTEGNNWITRALDGTQLDVENLLRKAFVS